ncbi:MAG: helix-turn-helix transcriptional regulator [Flavobacteriales bacterium]|nr:helix-turn-helix transcriptional regulator [Flavobacteriales bacterium]
MSLIGKNIKKIRTLKKLNQSNFADLFKLSRASIGSYEEERAEPKIDKIIEIANYFSIDINLLLKKELTVNEISGFKLTDSKMVTGKDNNLIKKDLAERKRIVYINKNTNSDFIKHLIKADKWRGETIELPPNLEIDTTIAFEHNDNAMNINNEGIAMTDTVFAESINIDNIFNNYTYIVVTKDSIYLRKLIVKENDIILNAVNLNFQPIIINKEDVIAFYKINAVIKKTINHFIS